MIRCEWSVGNERMQQYHDREWGMPVHDDTLLFEHLSLDCFQAGLSWQTVLNKRENFRKAFDDFNIEKVATYSGAKVEELLQNKGIIRNRMKIEAAINNANRIIELQRENGSFNNFLWKYTDGKPLVNHWKNMSEIPAKTKLSDTISSDLKKHGFKFVGSNIVYAFMQAIGMVNDHVTDCFRYSQVISSDDLSHRMR